MRGEFTRCYVYTTLRGHLRLISILPSRLASRSAAALCKSFFSTLGVVDSPEIPTPRQDNDNASLTASTVGESSDAGSLTAAQGVTVITVGKT